MDGYANRKVCPVFPQLYFHGEDIPIKIKINNESNKTVKKIKITGGFYDQYGFVQT